MNAYQLTDFLKKGSALMVRILAGLLGLVLISFWFGEGIFGKTPMWRATLTGRELIMMVFFLAATVGLILGVLRPRTGGLLTTVAMLGFLAGEISANPPPYHLTPVLWSPFGAILLLGVLLIVTGTRAHAPESHIWGN